MSNVNTVRWHQWWTRQLHCGSILLPHPSMLHASRSSLHLALGLNNEVMLYGTGREGVIAREHVASRNKPHLHFVLRIRLQKRGIFAGHYGVTVISLPGVWSCTLVSGYALHQRARSSKYPAFLECNSTQLNRLLINVPHCAL